MIKETIQAVEDAEAKASELVAQASEDARRVKAEAEAYVKQALAEAEAECQTLRETADRRKLEVVDRLIAELV